MKTDKFIFTHTDCTCPDGWEIIDNRNSVLDHRMWSEIAGLKTVYDRYMQIEEEKKKDVKGEKLASFPPDFVCTAHYRRRPDPLCTNRIYIAQPMMFGCSVAQQYQAGHHLEDLTNAGKAIKELFPNMVQFAEQVLNGRVFCPYNIVYAPYGQFMDWAAFLLRTLDKVAEYMGRPDYEKMCEIMSNRPKYEYEGRNNDPTYQARVFSFLSERLSTIYWLRIAQQVPVFPVEIIKTEGAW